MLRDLFEAIAWLFEDVLFIPLDWLRHLQDDSWFLANTLNWIFLIIGILAFGFWLKQLRIFEKEEPEETQPNPYLG
ncbi:MAG: uracil phosphoribosyltransferase [Christiangramia sp.]|uniref:Uncharacterized protein n=1 Tax=Christiangramia flava JLT2011 TaxID=1229726 RepID=A0A1L7I394_9FLAO|nr:hypothetical protein GRFL_1355 [Christiangramia flava JLT2011]OSS40581.1 hypothetical protein C723_0889 [Christiangramia flava JLT2011]